MLPRGGKYHTTLGLTGGRDLDLASTNLEAVAKLPPDLPAAVFLHGLEPAGDGKHRISGIEFSAKAQEGLGHPGVEDEVTLAARRGMKRWDRSCSRWFRRLGRGPGKGQDAGRRPCWKKDIQALPRPKYRSLCRPNRLMKLSIETPWRCSGERSRSLETRRKRDQGPGARRRLVPVTR